MAEPSLAGCNILIVEDEYLLAEELRAELEDEGAQVIGPAGTVQEALALVRDTRHLDGAVLDLNLGGEPSCPVAQALTERGAPLVFATGYDLSVLPPRFAPVPRCEKPLNMRRLTAELRRAVHA